MLLQIENNESPNNDMNIDLKNWVMIALTFIFILLYILALTGKLESLREWGMVTRMEPIIFVLIGYYFGRLPAQQNEKTLKEEINRQSQKADAAQHIKEKILQERESLEEKIKNTNMVLSSIPFDISIKSLGDGDNGTHLVIKDPDLRTSITTAINILKS